MIREVHSFRYAGPIVTLTWQTGNTITMAGDQLVLMQRRVQRLTPDGGWTGIPPGNFGRARKLRQSMSPPEVAIWNRLREKQLGVKFRKQHPVGPYIANFYSRECGLVVEIDGEQHDETAEAVAYDVRRDTFMAAHGLHVLRLESHIVGNHFEDAVNEIARLARQRIPDTHPHAQWRYAESLRYGDATYRDLEGSSVPLVQLISDDQATDLCQIALEDAASCQSDGGILYAGV